MSQKKLSGANSAPRLVVKIIGSKQVKQFIEEPKEDSGEMAQKETNPPAEAALGDFKKTPENQDVTVSRSHRQVQHRVDSALWAVINQVPDRLCVTAPSGDRSRSYIHPRTPHSSDPSAAEGPQTTEQTAASEDRDKAELSSAVREELSDWRLSCLRSTEDEVAALDLTCSGTLNRSEITHLFLRNDIPLKLPTFSLLLQMFSDKNDTVQIHYRDLLQFIISSAFPEELHNDSELQ
ncbi:uncharacterized protein C1orf87 [Epinephelus fuscoguttatus]|uniref:uncharacterized protein C1orf87 n=1 Tax=Epinephelus fuscoguttatus TaxID=293821 RepID=UPI0020D17A7D|nr:uncharacterized protein C1orf87 [Epinephelus fuscoguttatus]